MSKKIVKSLLVASVLSASAGANATEIMFGFVGSATYHSQGEEIAAMVASMDGFNVTQRDLDSAVYNDLDSFDQVWVYDLSRVADNNAFQVQNYANISSWYNNRDQSAQNLIADGRIISSSSTYTSRWGMPAETAWIQNYASQLDAFGGGLVLGTDDSGYVLGINEINAQIGIDPFSGLYEDDPKLAIVDTESRFYIADVELCSDITGFDSPCINDNSSTSFVPTGMQSNGQFLTPVAYHGDIAGAFDNAAVSSTFGSTTFSVPEPGSIALLGMGLAGIGFRRKHKQKA